MPKETSLSALYREKHLVLSYELFPPKTGKGMAQLFSNLMELSSCDPSFITCTYGAGGSASHRTLEVLGRIVVDMPGVPVASHLTCVGHSADSLRKYLREAVARGVKYIVAIRGDAPKSGAYTPEPGGFQYAVELVALIKAEFPDLGILVGGYPEVHPEALSPESDLENLKRKVDAGGEVVITQLFYDNEAFYRFRDRCEKIGIEAPIVPGILPVTNLSQIKRITSLCGARLTDKLVRRMEAFDGDEEGQFSVGAYYAANQVEDLVERGAVPGVHFYVMNRARATTLICRALALGTAPGEDYPLPPHGERLNTVDQVS